MRSSLAAMALLVMVLLAGAPLACAPAGATGPRNAILVSIDTLRPDHLGCYGHTRATSPTLDALAAAGVRFADVTAAAPWTLPSHASMLTGLYPSHHGVKSHENRLPAALTTLAEELQGQGFETMAVVNSHNVGLRQFRLAQGFRHFEYVSETEEDPRTLVVTTPNRGAEVLARARELLSARDPQKPFFLFLHFYDVHTDFTPRPEYRAQFVAPYDGRLDGSTAQLIEARVAGTQLAADDLRWLREMYDAEIRQLDDELGTFLGWLDEHGALSETLLVVTSDHGEEFQEHGGLLHGRTQYQELLRVPLIVKGPGLPAGTVVETPVHGVDVTPTILAALGIRSRVRHDGLDLAPSWSGGALAERFLFGEADQNNRAGGAEELDSKGMARRGFDKLIVDRLTKRVELYDLEADPGEAHDLAPARGELARTLLGELERMRASALAPERIPPPTAEEKHKLDALGYGGDDDGK